MGVHELQSIIGSCHSMHPAGIGAARTRRIGAAGRQGVGGGEPGEYVVHSMCLSRAETLLNDD